VEGLLKFIKPKNRWLSPNLLPLLYPGELWRLPEAVPEVRLCL